jgi:hypothetical protein
MSKKHGNPNWGKEQSLPVVPTVTEFERKTTELGLTPDQYIRSEPLREWVRANRNSRYVPEPLLEAWGFEIDTTF